MEARKRQYPSDTGYMLLTSKVVTYCLDALVQSELDRLDWPISQINVLTLNLQTSEMD
ncbi:hypothetical protein AFUB_100330 [Aspergillus fumigatus A1163]|uniref:Uncharacterized protein n=1 Tax=Aspergillus fumigatus (strain CBS 144.89 / FGSC A1163 / CEA10) TaxID=451804 RepID=B0YET7_ASPFC|nr:hypothetical protein AFUB_100330 [Aspergillus fumigatus A1163]